MNFELLKKCIELLELSNFCEKEKERFKVSKQSQEGDLRMTYDVIDEDALEKSCFEKLRSLYRELETQLYSK